VGGDMRRWGADDGELEWIDGSPPAAEQRGFPDLNQDN
jgi:hypothetical protein